MARKTIFELYLQNNDRERDFARIVSLVGSDRCVVKRGNLSTGWTLKHMFEVGFREWKNRGRCISLEDYLETIDFESIKMCAGAFSDSFLTYIEVIYNAWFFVDKEIQDHRTVIQWGVDGKELRRLIDEVLSEMNQKAYYDPETEQCLIGEDSPQVTAAAEASEPEVASLILQYNYRQLVGDVSKKNAILVRLGHEIMGKESELRANNQSNLFESITKALNNLDLRHNNKSPGSNDYKEKVAQLPDEELEKWYDETYQLILYAILILENIERKKRIDQFIKQISKQKEEATEDA